MLQHVKRIVYLLQAQYGMHYYDPAKYTIHLSWNLLQQ